MMIVEWKRENDHWVASLFGREHVTLLAPAPMTLIAAINWFRGQ